MQRSGKATVLVFLLLLVLVAVGALAFVAYSGGALTKQDSDQRDQEIAAKIGEIYAGSGSDSSKAKLIQAQMSSIHGEKVRAQMSAKLADLYEKVGLSRVKDRTTPGAIQEAEEALLQANALEPENAKYMADLGDVYAAFAKQQTDVEGKRRTYDKATDWLRRAVGASKADPNANLAYRELTGVIAYEEADALGNFGKYDEADKAIQIGLDAAPKDSATHKKLESLRTEIVSLKKPK